MNDKFIFDLANAPLCRREETERSGVARSSRDESCLHYPIVMPGDMLPPAARGVLYLKTVRSGGSHSSRAVLFF